MEIDLLLNAIKNSFKTTALTHSSANAMQIEIYWATKPVKIRVHIYFNAVHIFDYRPSMSILTFDNNITNLAMG